MSDVNPPCDGEVFAIKGENIAMFMHEILFAYQKSMKEILGSGSAVFLHPTLDIINRINKETRKNLTEGNDIQEVFGLLAKALLNSGIVQEFRLEKITSKEYVLHVNGCVWAPHIHEMLTPKELICPFALIVMALFQDMKKCKVKTVDSEYLESGSRTEISSI
jgi:hypothetical protein